MKRIFYAVCIIFCLTIAFALSQYRSHHGRQLSQTSKAEFFGFATTNFFPDAKTCRPNEHVNVNAVLTSNSSINMYVWIVIDMPTFQSTKGLYTFEANTDWVLQESGINSDERYYCVYRYGEPLEPEATTTPLTDKFTMRDMSISEYGSYSNVAIGMDAYSSGTDGDTDPDAGWEGVKSEYGL